MTVGEMVISQSFDFPTLYATRGKMNRLKTNALDAQATAFRQQILLQAKEVCLDIIMLQRQQALLDERLKNAEELSAMYTRRLEMGDANALETNNPCRVKVLPPGNRFGKQARLAAQTGTGLP